MASSPESHCERLERVYHAAPTNRLTPAAMHVEPGAAELEMSLDGDYTQAVGGVHGMIYFKVLDETAFYAANSVVEDVFLTTASMNVQFVAPVTGPILKARARVVHEARSSILVDAEALGEAGTLLARATGTFVRTQVPLPPLAG